MSPVLWTRKQRPRGEISMAFASFRLNQISYLMLSFKPLHLYIIFKMYFHFIVCECEFAHKWEWPFAHKWDLAVSCFGGGFSYCSCCTTYSRLAGEIPNGTPVSISSFLSGLGELNSCHQACATVTFTHRIILMALCLFTWSGVSSNPVELLQKWLYM